MASHGHAAVAVDYLTRWSGEGRFPYRAAAAVSSHAKDDKERRGILRSALSQVEALTQTGGTCVTSSGC